MSSLSAQIVIPSEAEESKPFIHKSPTYPPSSPTPIGDLGEPSHMLTVTGRDQPLLIPNMSMSP